MKKEYILRHLEHNERKLSLTMDYIYNFQCKNDYIKFMEKYDKKIRVIDVAIPTHIKQIFMRMNFNSDLLCTVYFHNGKIEYINMIEHCYMIIKSGVYDD